MEKILYTAEAAAAGGREGHVRSSDGRLDLDVAVPAEMGVAGGRSGAPGLEGSSLTARVGLGPTGTGGFGWRSPSTCTPPASRPTAPPT